MDKVAIKDALIRDGYPDNDATDVTVERLFNLQDESKDMLTGWLNYGVAPEFNSINGINSTDLRNKVEMKNGAIVLAFDMLVNHPETSSMFKKLINKQVKYKPQ